MILIDMDMPKTCKECPMNYYTFNHGRCACVYFQLGDMKRETKQMIMEIYITSDEERPKWCPLKEVKQ